MNTFLYLKCVQFLGEIDFRKVIYLHNIHIWIWIIAVNHLKTSKFNETFEFPMISWYYSYNIHNNMLLLVSYYPDFLITSCIFAFENNDQSIVLYGLRAYLIYRATSSIDLLSLFLTHVIRGWSKDFSCMQKRQQRAATHIEGNLYIQVKVCTTFYSCVLHCWNTMAC